MWDGQERRSCAICRGIQTLNVALGGTLHQHLPDIVGEGLAHSQALDYHEATHPVTIAGGSLLARVVGPDDLTTNSFHHQAICDLGRGLWVTSRSADGIIEAAELPDRRFVLAVQWHPEGLVRRFPRHLALFQALVAAAQQTRAQCAAPLPRPAGSR